MTRNGYSKTSNEMKEIPGCPVELPANISDLVRKLGNLWVNSNICPQIGNDIKIAWD
jgi:hypothetical protein